MNLPSLALLSFFIGLSFSFCIRAYRLTKKDLKKELEEQPLKKTKREDHIYAAIEPYALNIRISLQMLAGIGLVALLIIKLIHNLLVPLVNSIPYLQDTFLSQFVYHQPTLTIVGFALAYSTAIELAYTLFTPSPDEAINPLVLGLSATILILLSKVSNFDFNTMAGFAILVVVLAGLFLFSKKFVDREDEKDTDKANTTEVSQQTPQVSDEATVNPLKVTGSFQITTSNQGKSKYTGLRLLLYKLLR